jgi:hypothetical protein
MAATVIVIVILRSKGAARLQGELSLQSQKAPRGVASVITAPQKVDGGASGIAAGYFQLEARCDAVFD